MSFIGVLSTFEYRPSMQNEKEHILAPSRRLKNMLSAGGGAHVVENNQKSSFLIQRSYQNHWFCSWLCIGFMDDVPVVRTRRPSHILPAREDNTICYYSSCWQSLFHGYVPLSFHLARNYIISYYTRICGIRDLSRPINPLYRKIRV